MWSLLFRQPFGRGGLCISSTCRIAVLGSFYWGFYLLDELLNGDLCDNAIVVGLATDEPAATFASAERRVWRYPHFAGERLWTRPINEISVKGIKGEIPVYELVAIRGGDVEAMVAPREQAVCEITRESIDLLVRQQDRDAADLFWKLFKTMKTGSPGS